LDTSLYIKGLECFSFLGADLFMIVKSKSGIIEIFEKDSRNRYKKTNTFNSKPLEVLKRLAKQYGAIDLNKGP